MVKTEHQAPIFFANNAYKKLKEFLNDYKPSLIFILVDSNTRDLCLPAFLPLVETTVTIEVLEIDAGEENKNIETCSGLWNVLSELGADRKSLMINLGGGVVTDLGGFVASTFKRGIAYINIPTTLLSMVDASVGGKTGVDLGNLKNQIGVITQPEMVLIDSHYLATLSPAEMRSGLAEILKHGLIANTTYWRKTLDLQGLTIEDLDTIIAESIEIKSNIVKKDPREENLRKTLNFGHTFGHAIESYFLTHQEKTTLLHGEAVAAGMIIAAYMSTVICGLSKAELEEITSGLLDLYPVIDFDKNDFEEIVELLKYDKKNSHGKVKFVLLERIGQPVIDVEVPLEVQIQGLEYYLNIKSAQG